MRVLGRITSYVWAIVMSAVTAAIVYALQVTILVGLDEIYGSSTPGLAHYAGLIVFVLAVPAFVMGLMLVGLPTWFVAQRRGCTRYRDAAITGAVETTVVGALLLALILGLEAAVVAIGLPLSGAVGGLTFRWLIDDRPKQPPARPS